MNDKCICEKCGAEMKPLSEIYPIGMTCPNCGWGWATTYIDPINLDESDYHMILVSSENSFSNIKIALSKTVETQETSGFARHNKQINH